MTLLIGSYTEAGQGVGAGVSIVDTDDDGFPQRVLRSSLGIRNPSFVALDGAVVYAVEELDDGAVVTLDAETLELLSRVATGGAHPCHVVRAPDRPDVFAANYTSGTASVLGMDNGRLVGPLQVLAHPGTGPVAGRQESSHAHQCTLTGEGTVLVADLGADRVDEYVPMSSAGYRIMASADLPPGTGPRHVALRGTELLVVGELDGRLHRLRRSGKGWAWLDSVALSGADVLSGRPDVVAQPSHLELSADGSLAYAAIRGRNTIAVVALDGTGVPRLLAEVDCGGDWPRHFALDPGRGLLYVANERSGNIAIFTLGTDGIPIAAGSFAIGSPTCIVLGGAPTGG